MERQQKQSFSADDSPAETSNKEAMMLAEKHQKEKEKLHEKIMEMEAKLNETQELELEIEKQKGNTNVMKHMVGSDGDVEFVEKMAKAQIELAEKHQKEKEKFHEKIMEMEAKLNETQELELEIEKLKGNTNVLKHMVESDGDAEFLEKIAKAQIEVEARIAALQDEMMSLVQKERVANDEYQGARKEMIKFWNANEDLVSGEKIRVKSMGQLNPEPFLPAVRRKHRGSEARAEIKAMELCSIWEENIGDVQWYPFKVDESDGIAKRVVDKNYGKLLKLKDDYGEEVYNEVVRAKLEMEEHNASGGYVILELWNFEKNRIATLEEAADVMFKLWKNVVAMAN